MKTPAAMLRRFVSQFAIELPDSLGWEGPRRSLADSLLETIGAADRSAQDRIYSVVDRIAQFSNEYGRQILRGVLEPEPATLADFDAQEDVSACAILVWRTSQEAFDQALAAMYAHRLLNGRNWTGLDFEGKSPIVRPNVALASFQNRIREIFSSDGPPPQVTVDRFTRRERADTGEESIEREQFTIYVEELPISSLVFGPDAKVEPRVVRPVLEGAILLDATDGTLDVVCKRANKDRRLQIAEAFVEEVLEPGAVLAARSRRTLALETLKEGHSLAVLPQDQVRNVAVVALGLSSPDGAMSVTVETTKSGSVLERMNAVFGDDNPLMTAGWKVRFAKLRIQFEPEESKARPKIVTFELREPDRTNLRDQVERQRLVADQLLSRWGLYAPGK